MKPKKIALQWMLFKSCTAVSKMLILCIQSKNLLIKYINDEILPSDSLKTHVSIFLLTLSSFFILFLIHISSHGREKKNRCALSVGKKNALIYIYIHSGNVIIIYFFEKNKK
jgi:hypothetical protein